MTGSRGQANYAMANNFQDAFARQLAATGRPCLTLNLGSIMSVGFAAEHDITTALRRDGFIGITKPEFLALLSWACDPANPAACDPTTAQLVTGLAGAVHLPVEQFRSIYWTFHPVFRPLLRLNAVSREVDEGTAESKPQNNFAAQMSRAVDKAGQKEAALMALVDRLARLLAVPREDIDPKMPITAFGIDSLVALELRQWIGRDLKAQLNVFDIMQSGSVDKLAGIVTERSKLKYTSNEDKH